METSTELLSSLPRQHVAPEDAQGSSDIHVCGEKYAQVKLDHETPIFGMKIENS